MPNLISSINIVRDSVGSVLRIHQSKQAREKKGKIKPPQFKLALIGTAWCIVKDKYFVTAHHILNEGQARNPLDKFYIFVVPKNGPQAYHFPVISFPQEKPDVDIAILEIAPSSIPGLSVPALPVTFSRQADGTPVLTYGFPAPVIAGANLDSQGNWLGGNFFLKGHANEGIVSAYYELDGVPFYELNVGWHHGESGGPIIRIDEPISAFALMQQYRNIQSPHGVMAGPHRGRSLSTIENYLSQLGTTIV